jgi:NDP-sugar pyrophosphorylase family protein
MLRVVIPTAGTGSRLGNLTKYLNKSLISVNNKPVISHIIEHYPEDTEFVIALGYRGSLVRDFLEIAYPEKTFIFVNIDKFEGEGTGLGYTLLKCKEYLQQPFIFHSCDTMVFEIIPEPNENWMGYSQFKDLEQYRTIKIIGSEVYSIFERGWEFLEGNKPYIGLSGIYDYKEFWEAMEYNNEEVTSKGEVFGLNILLLKGIRAYEFEWCDTGNQKSLDFTRKIFQDSNSPNILEKSDEAIWFVNGKVIKFSDNKLFIKNRVKRACGNIVEYVPNIIDLRSNMYSYEKIEGKILSEVVTIPIFENLLLYSKTFWKEGVLYRNEYDEFRTRCIKFYKDKTIERVNLFYKTFRIEDKAEIINDVYIPKVEELLEAIDWNWLAEGLAGRYHGDFHFENILYSDGSFKFLDWRQDFGGDLELGDIYYDLAKLNHGLIICHELIAKNMFSVRKNKDGADICFLRKQILVECEKYYMQWLSDNGYDNKKVRILTALIYLNIAALHHDPYCKLLYYLGKSMLYKELK